MKKGLPKCVCAPNCKATAAAHKSQRMNSAKKVATIQMPETRNLKRNERRLTPSEMQSDEPTLIIANFNRRPGKKINQKHEGKKALTSSPMTNENLQQQQQLQIGQQNTSNGTDLETKLRSGFYNDQKSHLASYVDEFYIGNSVNFRPLLTLIINLISAFLMFSQPKFTHYNPICGSDGKTYKNECQLRKRACRQENKMLDVAYKGHCQSKKSHLFNSQSFSIKIWRNDVSLVTLGCTCQTKSSRELYKHAAVEQVTFCSNIAQQWDEIREKTKLMGNINKIIYGCDKCIIIFLISPSSSPSFKCCELKMQTFEKNARYLAMGQKNHALGSTMIWFHETKEKRREMSL